ncbi:hypothetical protein C8R41DRAFT_921591 [Lentinula lateritia]|uniref:Uncharacterized protein n=1 Tax=Lentinula lateritia TaxID=40482 RepID=A0ABQ8VAY9_9AGAR|nr:hypothetical protein C8R41DRAFT_921591 [Lentinula lateritia]
MVLSGYSWKQVGGLIQRIGHTFGLNLTSEMSRRTVSRAILEGGVAVKLQMGYEILNTPGMTLSADSTSRRKQNYESRHIALQVPDYAELKNSIHVKPASYHRVCFFVIEATNDHSSQGSPSVSIGSSPFGIFSVSFLGGTEIMLLAKRHLQEESEKKLAKEELADVILYLASWNAKKLEEVGGIEAWNALTPQEQAHRDVALMKEILDDLGQKEYDNLPEQARRNLDRFIWAGCCMHKDMNSFKGGNSEMMAEWAELGVDPPVLLANEANASILHKVLNPGLKPCHKVAAAG